jgi:hypothetical protein
VQPVQVKPKVVGLLIKFEVSMNPYFELSESHIIKDVESLLSLNVKKAYYSPGDETQASKITDIYLFPHYTAGIFRGQLYNWPLIPKCYRGLEELKADATEVKRTYEWIKATHQFSTFCERAEVQNTRFPSGISNRMSIAQHFGVPTPLLDWSQNIFSAIFFAIRNIYADPDFENSLRVFVYHITDERLLHAGIHAEDSKLSDFGYSAFVKPYPIDRRIERQRGVFTYHPHPAHRPPKVPATEYIIEWPLIEKLLALMKGFGFTEDYYFPDYAGIAQAVLSDTSL